MAVVAHPVVTDLTARISSSTGSPSTCDLDTRIWHRVEKELYLFTSPHKKAWLYVALANEEDLASEDLVVEDICVGEQPPIPSSGYSWEERPGGIWVLRSKFSGNIDQVVTDVDVLFGTDAVDPRPQRILTRSSLQLDAPLQVPVARLSILHGRAVPDARAPLRIRKDGKFKIVQISDTHMVTGVGLCKDAIDVHGKHLPKSEADPLTVDFIGKILDVEKPDLVILSGDQLHHDVSDTQSALFKVVAPIIARSIPFAAIFGNHDSEGTHALSRIEQMSILENLPFSLCESGPEQVDGIGNFYLQVLAPVPSQIPVSTFYFLDSHGQIPSRTHNPDYEPIKQSQIDWFTNTSHAQQSARQINNNGQRFYISLAFLHIPLPEFKDRHLRIYNGHRWEPTECPSSNSHFYDALVRGGISALGCGHDHVNDFCALLPQQTQQDSDKAPYPGPWLCYSGGSGFGGYCSYGRKRFHRRMRVWEVNASNGSLKTWKRVEYSIDRVDEISLVESGAVVDSPGEQNEGRSCVVT
ncbi:related to DCR2 Dosage-dependent positive regulator of the G1/S phase transition by controlling the timing of START [Rhynchosporium agropyri]|uniref:Related to DCR2 Dosage-dependent positive regulator of the G1/S phase transition by controlling the timing of START n=1 Tax=Rhynchosporium agropyri TaxID=914238 RepID=A0A1E1K720_9HELO|nr:related to DCR2 Dosage-dependent positive regulator of the G1/S phase transition by controlling the timing of START [Rhynchosporium agropyri]